LNIDILKYFIQNEIYWEGLGVVPILLVANIFLGIYYNQSIWYKLSNKTKFGALIAIMGAILTIVLNIVFIPKYGYWASAWATLAVYGFQMVLSYILGQKHYPIRYNLGKFGVFMIASFSIYYVFSRIDFELKTVNIIVKNSGIILFLSFFFLVERFWKEK
jgi:O-antigen/teichoic acid export membrane protein